MTLLELSVVFDEFAWIVTDRCGDATSRVADCLDGWIVLHHVFFRKVRALSTLTRESAP